MGKGIIKILGSNAVYLATAGLLVFLLAAPLSIPGNDLVSTERVGTRLVVLKPLQSVSAAALPGELTDTAAARIARRFLENNRKSLGLQDRKAAFAVGSVTRKSDGSMNVRFVQKRGKLKVLGGEINVHLNSNGATVAVNAKIAQRVTSRRKPRLSEVRALRRAKQEARIRSGGRKGVTFEKPELVLLADFYPLEIPLDESRLAWKVAAAEESHSIPMFAEDVYIDAVSGKTLGSFSNLRFDDVPLTRHVFDCACPHTLNWCCMNMYYGGDLNYTFGRFEGAPPRGPYPIDTPAIFAGRLDTDNLFDLLGMMDQYLMSDFGLDGANNMGGLGTPGGPLPPETIRAFTLTENDTSTYSFQAAFHEDGQIGFGAGMPAVDTVGHEFGHAVAFNAFPDENGHPIGAVYYGETGALEEAFADVFGESFELYVMGSNDWVAGTNGLPGSVEDDTVYGPIRSLRNPQELTYEYAGNVYPYPARYYDASLFCGTADSGGVHLNATVPGHAFYLIAQGGVSNGCEIAPQGIEVAKKLFHRVWTDDEYFTSTVTFNEAYYHINEACSALSAELSWPSAVCINVRNALQAVEMDQPGFCADPDGTQHHAPECTQFQNGQIESARPSLVRTQLFAPTERITAVGSGWMGSDSVRVVLSEFSGPRETLSAVVPFSGVETDVQIQPDGGFAVQLWRPDQGVTGSFEIVVDRNKDGYFQPSQDRVIQLEVAVPEEGDGLCYTGEYYQTSENCNASPSDCACPTNQICRQINDASHPEKYICSSGIRWEIPRGKVPQI